MYAIAATADCAWIAVMDSVIPLSASLCPYGSRSTHPYHLPYINGSRLKWVTRVLVMVAIVIVVMAGCDISEFIS